MTGVWASISVLLPAVASQAAPMSTIDLAYQVRAGELMLDRGQILRTDPFTFTIGGQPWLDQQWLGQVAVAALYRSGGWPLIAIAHAAVVGATFALLVAALRARGLSTRVAGGLAIVVFIVSLAALGMRPQVIGVACFAATLWALGRGNRTVWLVPLIALIWANVHGSFVLAPILVGLAWLDAIPGGRSGPGRASPRALVGVGALTLVATLVTPFGAEVWRYALGLATSEQVSRLVTEWQRTTPTTYAGVVFYVSLVVVAVLAWRLRQQLRPAAIVGLVGFAVLGIYAERGTVWWAFAAPWLLAPTLSRVLPPARRADRRSTGNLVLVGLVALLGLAVVPWPSRSAVDGPLPLLSDVPTSLTDRLVAAVPSGARVLVAQPWASWTELAAPGRLTMVDARFELFPDSVWSDYLAVSTGSPDAGATLDRWHVDAALVSATDQPGLLRMLHAMPGWHLLVEEPDGALFVRSGG